MQELVEELIEEDFLKTSRIIEAFLNIDRADFIPKEMKPYAYVNEALPIGSEQTISQPGVVALMLELLQPKKGDRILDVGAGSGWTTALLAYLVGNEGKVIGMELVPELAATAKSNISKYRFIEEGRAQIIQKTGERGYEKEAPFDKILISANLPTRNIPQLLKDQLSPGGTIVTPAQSSIWVLQKINDEEFKTKEYPGFVFVPFKYERKETDYEE